MFLLSAEKNYFQSIIVTNEIVEVYLTLIVVKYGNENHHPIKSIYHFFPRVVTLPAFNLYTL